MWLTEETRAMRQVTAKLDERGQFEMANRELAKVYELALKTFYPSLVVIHSGIYQYFILNSDGGKRLRAKLRWLEQERERALQKAEQLTSAIAQIEKELEGK